MTITHRKINIQISIKSMEAVAKSHGPHLKLKPIQPQIQTIPLRKNDENDESNNVKFRFHQTKPIKHAEGN